MMNRKDELEEQNAYVEIFCFSAALTHAQTHTDAHKSTHVWKITVNDVKL